MPYLGNEPAVAFTSTTKDSFSGDGSTTDFTMSKSANVNAVRVVVENVVQNPTVAYTCSGTTLSFTSAPPTGTNNIYVVHLGPPAATVAPPTTINNATTFTGGVTFDRSTSDGDIAAFKKDGSAVGSIGTEGGSGFDAIYIANGDAGLIFQGYANDAIIPFDASNLDKRDAAIDLGYASGRFKDLYLSGGIVFGDASGTNVTTETLSGYEEGSFTPVYSIGTGTITTASNAGKYVKIGDLVHCHFRIRSSGASGLSGAISITGFPFTAVSDARSSGSKWFARNWGSDMPNFSFGIVASTSEAYLYKQAMNATASSVGHPNFSTGGDDNVLEASITYQVA